LLHPDLGIGQSAAPECPVVKLLISGTWPVPVPTFLVAASPKPTFSKMQFSRLAGIIRTFA
ncbi:hypothetical protein, partial [Escherichia coli]|uniref:hypothetical protein n=1 Tax=Escherichia coli TaxID=562 RepID=UPI001BFCD857